MQNKAIKGIKVPRARSTKNGHRFINLARQSGFTLFELAVTVGIIAAVIGAAAGGNYLRGWYNGKTEGDVIANALNCGRATWTSSSYAGITLRNMVDNSCFPSELSTGKGTAGASAKNNFGTAYTIASTTVVATNDGIQVTSAGIPSGACASAIQTLAPSASTVSVTNGAGTTVVKAAGAAVNDSNVSAACGGGTTVSIIAAATKTGT